MAEPCWCATCRPVSFGDMRMVLCPVCGNKRCPHATDHRYACTGSNDVGQVGSAYIEQPKPQGIINGASMSPEEIQAIAQRPTYCKADGEAVTLSRAERDALVALARDGLLLREKFTSGNAIQVERVTVRFDELAPGPCNCAKCRPHSMEMRMILCSKCGNKRCPHATDHRNACTGSNERGQAGTAYD